jgi:hypothetical protein
MKIVNNNTKDNEHVKYYYPSFSFSEAEKHALYKTIFSRRDVRSHFIEDKKIFQIIFYGEY